MTYKEMKKEYRDLEKKYIEDREKIIDEKHNQLEDLKDQYKLDRIVLRKPLKAEEYRIKIEKKKKHRMLNDAPRRKTLEEIGNSVSHGVGALLGILFLVLMILKSTTPLSLTAAIIYGTCFFLQMLFSCLYHAFKGGTVVKRIFRRFDYSSIYLQIGGTFAPLFLIYMVDKMWGLEWGLTLFIIQWALIALGVTFVGVFGPGRIRWLHFTLYFAVGWSGLMFLPAWFTNDLYLALWILGGGVTYTLGMIPFAALKNRPVSHFIWHLVVLAAAILMWVGIYLFVF
jgi:hemolysin III